MQKNWIGRSKPLGALRARSQDFAQWRGRTGDLHHPRRHAVGAKFMALSPDHRSPVRRRRRIGPARLHRRMQEDRHRPGGDRQGRKARLRHRHPRRASVRSELDAAVYCRQFHPDGVRHRRHFRLPGARPRDLDFVNKYGLGNVPVVCPPDVDPKTFVITDTAYDGDGRMLIALPRWLTIDDAKNEVAKRLKTQSARNRPVGQRQVNYRLRDWGISRQRYWGCRSRSSIATPAAPCRCRPRTCRWCCRRTSSSTVPAIRSTAIRPGSTSPARNAGQGAARNRHHGHLRRLVLVLYSVSPIRGSPRRRPTARWSTA